MTTKPIVPEEDRKCMFCEKYGDPLAKKEGVLKKCLSESEIRGKAVFRSPGQIACLNFVFSQAKKDAHTKEEESHNASD